MRMIGILLAFVASPVAAQVSYPPLAVDPAVIATKADVQAQIAGKADITAIPSTCTQPPAPDASTATAGSGTPCTPRIDAARQTPIPPASAVTVSGGGFSGVWGMTLTAAPTRAIATVEGATPYHCQIINKTASSFTGKCWLVNTSTTLPSLATSLLGYTVPLLVDSAAGIAVTVLARQ